MPKSPSEDPRVPQKTQESVGRPKITSEDSRVRQKTQSTSEDSRVRRKTQDLAWCTLGRENSTADTTEWHCLQDGKVLTINKTKTKKNHLPATQWLTGFPLEIQRLLKDFHGPWSCIFKDQFSTEVYSMDSITAIFNVGFCDYRTVLVDKNKTR